MNNTHYINYPWIHRGTREHHPYSLPQHNSIPYPTRTPAPLPSAPPVQQPAPPFIAAQLDPGMAPTPAIAAAFFAPGVIKTALTTRKEAQSTGNTEALHDAHMRLITAPSTILYAIPTLAIVLINFLYFFEIYYHPAFTPLLAVLSPLAFAAGCLLCLSAGAFEIVGTARQIRFLNKTSFEMHSRKEVYTYLRNRFFILSTQDKDGSIKIKDLARRIDPNSIMPLKALLDQSRPCLKCIDKTLHIARTQAKKKLIIHLIGLAAITLATITLVLSFFALCHPFALTVLIGLTLVCAIARGALIKGWWPTEDWSFSLKKAFPILFVRSRIAPAAGNTGLSLANLLAFIGS